MNNEQLNTALYEKLFEEQQKYRNWLKGQPPETILNHAYEYTIREDLLLSLEYHDLTDAQAKIMLESRDAMDSLFREFEKMETGYMESIWECVEHRADTLLKRQTALYHTPVYPHDAAYAREHGELDQFRDSHRANIACKEAIETAIAAYYYDNRLHSDAVTQVLEQFCSERVSHVLAVTCIHKDWDARISEKHKNWAKQFSIEEKLGSPSGDRDIHLVIDRCHPGLTDLFIGQFLHETQRVRETSIPKENRLSVLMQLKAIPPAKETATQKKPEQEL